MELTRNGSTTISGSATTGFQFVRLTHPLILTTVGTDGNYILGPEAPTSAVSVTGASSGFGISVADFDNCAIRQVTTAGIVTTTVVGANCGYFADGTGALFNIPKQRHPASETLTRAFGGCRG